MKFDSELKRGRLIKRYKRFLADVELDCGEIVTAHCPNTGGMLGCQEKGSLVWLRYAPSPKRKLDYSWELASTESDALVGIYSAKANQLVEEAWKSGSLKAFKEYSELKREVKVGSSRLDLLFSNESGQCYVEVKSVTASTEPGVALFPDARTLRGVKHLQELVLLKQEGHRVAMIFCVQRGDADALRTAPEFDAGYAEQFKYACEMGVEAYAYVCEVTPEYIRIEREIEILS